MFREKLNGYLTTHKDKIVRIGCHSIGVIVMCAVWGKAIKRHSNYIVTDLVVSDLGKLGEHLIEHGRGANDKVLRWRMDFAKM